MVTKTIVMTCGCNDIVEVRPRESRMYLRAGMKTECSEHGQQTITWAKEIEPDGA